MQHSSRQYYRKSNPKGENVLRNKRPLTAGTPREVTWDGNQEGPDCFTCYTIPETAMALGKTVMTFKKWINNELIPAPICRDTSRNYFQYTREEVNVFARILGAHFETYDYLHHKHTDLLQSIAIQINKVRQHHGQTN